MASTKADERAAAEDKAKRRRIIDFPQKETAGDVGAEPRSARVDAMGSESRHGGLKRATSQNYTASLRPDGDTPMGSLGFPQTVLKALATRS
jgi:hypothetical protein